MSKTHVKSVGRTDFCKTDGHLSDGQTSVGWTDICWMDGHIQTPLKKCCILEKLFNAPIHTQIILLLPPWQKDSKNGLRFEISPWGGVDLRVDKWTNEQTESRYFNIARCYLLHVQLYKIDVFLHSWGAMDDMKN